MSNSTVRTEIGPLFPDSAPTETELIVPGDTLFFHQDSARKTYIVKGTAKIREHDFTLGAEEMSLEMEPGTSQADSTETIDPLNLKSFAATGLVTIEGKIDGVELSARANSAIYSKRAPEPGIILTGRPWLKSGDRLIEGREQDSKIILGSDSTIRVDKCRIFTEPNRKQPSTATPDPPETPIPSPEGNPPASPFAWMPVSLNGLDYLPLWQVKDFYKFPTLSTTEPGKAFLLRSPTMIIKGTKDTNHFLINNVKYILRHPILSSEGMPMISRQDLSLILDPVLRPSRMENYKTVTTVVIDPGHGGTDLGAAGPQGKEAAYTLDTALRLKRKLGEAGIKAVLTRTEDRFMPLQERADFAAAHPEAILISLHFNHGPPAGQGLQTFYPDKAFFPGDDQDQAQQDYHRACVALATAVHANGLFKLRIPDGGIRPGKFTVISGQTKTPAILIECGYLSHPAEAARIATDDYRQSLAEAVSGSVSNYLRAIREGSTIPLRK